MADQHTSKLDTSVERPGSGSPVRARWVGPAVLVAIFGIPLALAPQAFLGALTTTRGVVLVVGVSGALAVWSGLSQRLIGQPSLRAVAVAVPAAAVAAALVWPTLVTVTADEELADGLRLADVARMDSDPIGQRVEGPAIDAADDAEDVGRAAIDAEESEPAAIDAAQPDPEPEPTPEPTGPVVLAAGVLEGRNRYNADGRVALVDTGAATVLRFEDLATDNGPALRVWLVPVDASETRGGLIVDVVDLGDLRATSGNLTYELPADLDLDAYRTAVIWCDRIGAEFGVAALS